MDVYGHVSRQMQINSANKLESFIQNVSPGGQKPTGPKLVEYGDVRSA